MRNAYSAFDLSSSDLLNLPEGGLRLFATNAKILRRDITKQEFTSWLYSTPCRPEAKQIPLYVSLDGSYFLVQRYLDGDPNLIFAYPSFSVPYIPGPYGGIFPFYGNQFLRPAAQSSHLQNHLSDFDLSSARFFAKGFSSDNPPTNQHKILYLCEPKDATYYLSTIVERLSCPQHDSFAHSWRLDTPVPPADQIGFQGLNESLYRKRLFEVLKQEQHDIRLETDPDYADAARKKQENAENALREETHLIRSSTAPVLDRYRLLLESYNLNFHLCLDVKANSSDYSIDYVDLLITACDGYYYSTRFNPKDTNYETLPEALEAHLSAYVQSLNHSASANQYLSLAAKSISSSSEINRYLLASLPSRR